jgi:hypothetical protein
MGAVRIGKGKGRRMEEVVGCCGRRMVVTGSRSDFGCVGGVVLCSAGEGRSWTESGLAD